MLLNSFHFFRHFIPSLFLAVVILFSLPAIADELRFVYPNDPYFALQENLYNWAQYGGKPNSDVYAPFAWPYRTSCRSVKIGIIDSGFDFKHPDLFANFGFNYAESLSFPDGIDNDDNGYIDDYLGWNFFSGNRDAVDDYGHGTVVAGLIGAVGNNSIGITGICWDAHLIPLKVYDLKYAIARPGVPAPYSALVLAIDYAIASKIDLLHISIGMIENPEENLKGIEDLDAAIERANVAGIAIVIPAGNSADGDMNLETFTLKKLIPQQLQHSNLIKVAATDNQDQLSKFSMYGPNTVQIAAPGVAVLSTIPLDSDFLQDTTGQLPRGYNRFTGTSLAAPLVTGAVALLLSQSPGLTPDQIIRRLIASSDRLPALEGKTKGGRLNVWRLLNE